MKMVAPHSKRKMPLAYSMLAAGEAVEMSDDYQLLDVSELITNGRENVVAYVVTGDSMVEFIRNGNIVFVESGREPQNGDIVASCVNGLYCVKIFQRGTNGLFLVSANKKYLPREVKPTDSFHILGVIKAHLAVY